jgi:hypothetical protein
MPRAFGHADRQDRICSVKLPAANFFAKRSQKLLLNFIGACLAFQLGAAFSSRKNEHHKAERVIAKRLRFAPK